MHYSITDWENLPWWQQWVYMDELNKHIQDNAEFQIKLAGGGSQSGASMSQREIDPDADAPDIMSAGLGIVPM